MIVLGIILLLAGLFIKGLSILVTIGVIVLVIGAILAVAGGIGHAVGPRRHYW